MGNAFSKSAVDFSPEIDQHQVRYKVQALKSSNTPKKSPMKRKLITFEPPFDPEIDDECKEPPYKKFALSILLIDRETIGEEVHKKKKTRNKKEIQKKGEKAKGELSFEYIYKVLHEMKFSTIQSLITESKTELLIARNGVPSKKDLEISTKLLSTMFNPEQKNRIYSYIKETLNIPKTLFKGEGKLITVVKPEAALLIFQKKFKFETRTKALGKLAELELLNDSFYKHKAAVDFHCRTK